MTENELVPQDSAEITIIEDEQGLAVLGDPAAVEKWLNSNNLMSQSSTLNLSKLTGTGSTVATATGKIMEESGRWVKLTKESAALAKATKATSGVARSTNGQIIKHLKFAQVGGLFTPAGAAVLGGILAQKALEQSLAEITDYLKSIDEKIDDLLQDQKDRIVADLFSIRHSVNEAYILREETGSVSAVTWSKVANLGQNTAYIQKYALQKIQGLANKIEEAKSAGTLKKATNSMVAEISGWLIVLANALLVQDQLSVIELERVFADSPEAIESHRSGIQLARKKRIAEIEATMLALGHQLGPAWDRAQAMQIRNPLSVKAIFSGIQATDEKLDAFASALELEENAWNASRTYGWKVAVGAKASEKIDDVKSVARKIPKVEISFKQRDGS